MKLGTVLEHVGRHFPPETGGGNPCGSVEHGPWKKGPFLFLPVPPLRDGVRRGHLEALSSAFERNLNERCIATRSRALTA